MKLRFLPISRGHATWKACVREVMKDLTLWDRKLNFSELVDIKNYSKILIIWLKTSQQFDSNFRVSIVLTRMSKSSSKNLHICRNNQNLPIFKKNWNNQFFCPPSSWRLVTLVGPTEQCGHQLDNLAHVPASNHLRYGSDFGLLTNVVQQGLSRVKD